MGGTSSDRHESKTGETGNIDSKYESDVTKAGSGSGSTDIAVGDSAEMAVPAILNGTSSSQNESNGTEPADTEMKNNKDTANPASAMSPDHTVVDDTIEVAVQSAEYGDASNNDGAKKAEPEDITMEDAAQVTEHGEPAREDESSIAQSGATMDVEVHHPESDNADNESEEDEDQDDDTTMEDAFQAPDEELIITEHEKSDANDRDDGDNVTEHETTEAEAEDNHTDQEENDADGEDSDAGVEDEMMEKQMNIAEEREAQAGLPQYLAAARRTAAPTLQVAATSTRDDRPLTSTTPWEEERPAIEVPRWRTPSPIRPLSPALALEPIYEGDLREQFKFMWVRNIDILGKDGQLFESYLSGWYQKMKREGNLLLGKGVTKLKLEKKYAEAAAAFDAKFPSDFPDEVGEKDDGAQQRKKSTSDQIVLDGSARGFVVTARQMIDAGIFAGGGVTHNVASFVELVIGSDTRYSHEDIQLALRYLQEERYIKAGGYAGDGVFDNEMPLVFGNPKPHSG
ncbi:hypothetical protein BT63DRAFT_426825 [Microthyrium microscopicum]|uniref:Uncharacterized protein n=1 Tax=Microthyrium microscopicum TaxID=703497 RepID=A0A6A6U6W4_9PEZI|nr:hypothetical protein BT63DRAFT_426825 [Microthyrium microscopicum]